MASVGTVLIDVKADTAKLVSGMDRAEKTVKKTVGNIKKTILSMVAAYAGIQSIRAFKNMINDSLDAADAVGKLAQKLGLTSEQLSKYQYAAHFSAISTADLNAGLSAMIRRLNNFQRDGGGAAVKAFKELGISADYAREHFTSTDIAFKEILKRLDKMPNGFKKTAIAQDIFSKNASRILRLSAGDLKKFGDEAERIGITISQNTYQMAAAYHDQMDRIGYRLKGLERIISYSLVKPLNAASKTALEFVGNAFGQISKEKMLNFGKTGSKAIESIIYGLGFAKDIVTGIEFVIGGIKIAFYGLADVIALALEPPKRTINTMIDAYNYIAKKLGKNTINVHLESSIPDINKKIIDIKNDMQNLMDKMHDGRDAAEKFSGIYKTNLNIAAKEAKKSIDKTSKSIDNQSISISKVAKKAKALNILLSDQFNIWKKLRAVKDSGANIDYGTYYKSAFDDVGYGVSAYDKAVSKYKSLMGSATTASEMNAIEKAYKAKIQSLNETLLLNYKNTQKEKLKALKTWKDGAKDTIKEYVKDANDAYKNSAKVFGDIMSNMEDSLTKFVMTGKLSFKELANSIISDIVRIQVKKFVAGIGSSMLPSIGSLFSFADGGVMTSQGKIPLRAYADGGVTSTPQLALFGEGSTPEAFVPLPDGRSIPVTMKGGKDNVVINIQNNSGSQIDAKQISELTKTNERGERERVINIVIDGVNRNVNGIRDTLRGM